MTDGLLDVQDPWVMYAINQIKEQYGVVVSVDQRAHGLLKFGRGTLTAMGVSETVWQRGGDETYAIANTIDTISSSDVDDTEEMYIMGQKLDGNGDFVFVEQTKVLDGQNKVVLDTPLIRADRLRNANGVDLEGTVYCYEDDTIVLGVPQTSAKIHVQTVDGENHSLKGAVSIAANEFWLISQLYAAVNEKTAASAGFDFELRLKDKVFTVILTGGASSDGAAFNPRFAPYLVVPGNSDVRAVAKSTNTNNVDVEAWAHGVLARVIG